MANGETTQQIPTTPTTVSTEVLLTLAVRVHDRATRGGELAIRNLVDDLDEYAPGIARRFDELNAGN